MFRVLIFELHNFVCITPSNVKKTLVNNTFVIV